MNAAVRQFARRFVRRPLTAWILPLVFASFAVFFASPPTPRLS